MSTALIMEGGAMRGLFTCGVTDTLMAAGLRFDAAAGISAGAVFGCNVKSGQMGRALRYNRKYCRDWRYCSLRSLLFTGDLYGADFCYRELPEVLDPFDREAFRASPMVFYCGATDVSTGACAFHRCEDGGAEDMLWLRASASMPLVSRPVEADGRFLLDGGISCAVPYRFMREQGWPRQVIILTQPRGYRKKPVHPLLPLLLRRRPAIAAALRRRAEMYNQQMDELDALEDSRQALVIRPPQPLAIGHREKNPAELQRVYSIGQREAEVRLEEVRAFCAELSRQGE